MWRRTSLPTTNVKTSTTPYHHHHHHHPHDTTILDISGLSAKEEEERVRGERSKDKTEKDEREVTNLWCRACWKKRWRGEEWRGSIFYRGNLIYKYGGEGVNAITHTLTLFS